MRLAQGSGILYLVGGSLFSLYLLEISPKNPTLVFLFVFLFFLKESILFIYLFWLYWVFLAALGLSLVAVSGGYSSLRCAGFSLRWLLLLHSTGSRCAQASVVVARGLSSCGSRALERRLSSCGARA